MPHLQQIWGNYWPLCLGLPRANKNGIHTPAQQCGSPMWQPMYSGRSVKSTTCTVDKWHKYKPKTTEEKNDMTILLMTCLFVQVEKFLQTALTLSSRTIGLRSVLSLMWLYPVIKIPLARFPKNYIHTYIHTHIYKYTYILTYIHTHTHTHTHTYFINMTNTNTVYRSVTKKKITNKDLEIEFTKMWQKEDC